MRNKPPKPSPIKNQKRKVYWDACVLISLIQGDKPERMAELEPLLRSATDGKMLVVTSALTIGELLRGPARDEKDNPNFDHAKYVKSYLEHKWITVVATDRRVWEITADIRRQGNIKLPDAVHLATAIRSKVPVLETYNSKDFDKYRSWARSFGLIKIREPKMLEHFDLLDGPRGEGDDL